MKYFIVTDHQDLPMISQRLYAHNIKHYIKQLYSPEGVSEAHVVVVKPENMSTKDLCAICNVKEAYLYFDTEAEWP